MKLLPIDISTRKAAWERKTTVNTLGYLERSGLELSTLEEKLSIIHVSGTKGKVSRAMGGERAKLGLGVALSGVSQAVNSSSSGR